jgi:hypothetical protein
VPTNPHERCPALQQLRTPRVHNIDNDALLAYSKHDPPNVPVAGMRASLPSIRSSTTPALPRRRRQSADFPLRTQ